MILTEAVRVIQTKALSRPMKVQVEINGTIIMGVCVSVGCRNVITLKYEHAAK